MSTSKSKRRECDSPVRGLDKPADGQQVKTVEPEAANNNVQLEFLQFLKSLDDVPHQMGDGDNNHASIEEQSVRSEPGPERNPELGPELVTTASGELEEPEPEAETKLQQESLLNYNFILKLHLAASSDQVSFLNWSADGQQLQLDYIGLQEHLTGAQSMFRSRGISQFTRQILNVGFERVMKDSALDAGGPQLYYQHASFKCQHPEQLLLMPTTQFEEQVALKPAESCHSRLQRARCRFATLLSYHNDVRLLQERDSDSEQLQPRRGRISSSRQSMQSALAPALASKHMNPRDSVLHFESSQVPDYAGFYGRVEPSLINEFFAEYLPRYGARTSGYKDIVVDASKANAFQQNLPIGIIYSEDEDDLVDQDNHEATPLVPAGKIDDSQPSDNFNPPPEDIELEQVMQELCGVGADVEEDLEKKELVPLKPKIKRKKPVRKCASTEKDMESDPHPDDNGEDLLQAAAAAAAFTKDNDNDDNDDENVDCSTNDADKDLKCQTGTRSVSKRRRYDLRNSKSKRSR